QQHAVDDVEIPDRSLLRARTDRLLPRAALELGDDLGGRPDRKRVVPTDRDEHLADELAVWPVRQRPGDRIHPARDLRLHVVAHPEIGRAAYVEWALAGRVHAATFAQA